MRCAGCSAMIHDDASSVDAVAGVLLQDVRVKCVDLQDRKRVFTLRTDNHYWPTLELRRCEEPCAAATVVEGEAAPAPASASAVVEAASGASGRVVLDVGREWVLIRH